MKDLGVVGASHETFCTFHRASRAHYSTLGARQRDRPVAVLSVPHLVFQGTTAVVVLGSTRDRFPPALYLVSPAFPLRYKVTKIGQIMIQIV